MNIGTLLRALANGVNPDTGELLRPASAACAPEAILSACCSRWPTSLTVNLNCRKKPG